METWLTMIGWSFGLTVFCILLTLLANMYMAHKIAKFSVKMQNETVDKIKKHLGGKNCGECGCETCEEYATAMFYGQRGCESCPYAGEDAPEKMQAIMQDFSDFLEGKDQEGRPAKMIDRIKMWNAERKKQKKTEE